MFALRPYQQQIIYDCYSYIRQGIKRILLFSPTGSGKTVLAAKVIADAVSKNRRVLFIVHRDILVSQTYNKLRAVNLECGFIKSGWQENIAAPVQIASIQSLPTRTEWLKSSFDLIICDEAHITAFGKIFRQMLDLIFPEAIYLGLTATPWRLSKKESMGDIYHALVCAPMPKDLIEAGFLVKPSYYSLNFQAELKEVDLTNGDYNLSQLSNICDRPELIEQVVDSWYDLAYSFPTIAFTVSVAHAEHLAEAFTNHGIVAAAVTGKTPISQRTKLYQELADGKLKVLTSCAALSEGFDVPEVGCVILARPTKSKALYFQQIGRGLRLAPDKTGCIVLDQSQNVLEHGFIEDLTQEDIELFPSKSSKSSKVSQAPLKTCPKDRGGCGAYIYAVYLKCPHCGFSFEMERLITVLGNNHLLRPQDEPTISFYRQKLREAYRHSLAPPWAAYQVKDKFGFMPPFDWGRGAIFNHQLNEIEIYRQHLTQIADRLNKCNDWVELFLLLEFGKQVF